VSDPIDQEIRILRAIFWSERDPEGRAFVPLADAYLRKGSPDEALSLLEDGLGRHPDFASAHMVAARAYRAAGARGSVHRALGSVLELDPGNASALRMKGELAESEGNIPVAVAAFREALERNPDYEDLPGRIERLALGMPTIEPTSSAPEGFDPSSHDASAGALGGSATIDFDPIDAPHDDRLTAAQDDGRSADLRFAQEEKLPQDEALVEDLSGEGLASGEGVMRGSAVAGASTDFYLDPGPGDADLIDVDLGAADLAGPDLLEDGFSEPAPADSDFGIEDFPSDERVFPADGVTLHSSILGSDRLELAPPPAGGEVGGSDERRSGDLEAHEALIAERAAGRSVEARTPGDHADPNPGDVDVIDPFGFDPLVAPEWTAASPAGAGLSEPDLSGGQHGAPMESEDDDAPDWSLPSQPEAPRISGVEPLPVTRTLGELYARQGLISQAVGIFEALLERNPEDEALRARLSELRAGSTAPPADAAADAVPEASPSEADEADEADDADLSEPVEMVAVVEHDEAGLDEGGAGTGMSEGEEDGSLDASAEGASGGEGTPVTVGFSMASQPIGAWFGDLLAWAPGAVPVEELAPGAVPIESLAPVGWSAESVRASAPGSGIGSEAVLPELTAPEQAPLAASPRPSGRQLDPPASDAAEQGDPSDGDRSPEPPRQDGFEGLDDFQDWLRSLDR